ncbi:hypothetical protein [Nonomuraea jiangxiensis]|uniref:ATP-grasp domain-containing protein n=1 Tax=Nonomuraea jiangxiensis TaxID=633440 RepID=A0A1G9B9A1_9ACTN|nr:hypothetical protein [Nonomuraea jiangxiensis]SDK36142.1 hypothetical protein SAMN05421869_115198 [Nonomuraea jiangxiensis]
MIVILGDPRSHEVADVAAHLPAGRVLIVRPDWLDQGRTLTWSGTGLDLGSRTPAGDDVTAVYVRPTVSHDPRGLYCDYLIRPSGTTDPGYHHLVRTEAESTLVGALLGTAARWVNHPGAETIAEHKLRQLTVAREAGLRTPATLISDDPERLAGFWHAHGGEVVTKAVSSLSRRHVKETIVTRRVTAGHLAVLERGTPGVVLFQELVPAALDLRVTLVGPETFSCAIHSQEGDSPLDWRLDQSVPMTPHPLDPRTESALHQVRERLGLEYGAADLRLTPDGVPVFLEINPCPEFSFAEHRVGMPIARAVAALLQ